jgi:hypothetical protein
VTSRKEKRASPRIQPYIVPCQIVRGKTRLPGYLVELSAEGGRLTCEEAAPRVGSSVGLEFRIGRQVEQSKLRAVVRWIRKGPGESRSLGFRFARVGASARQALEEVVDDFRRKAEALVQS